MYECTINNSTDVNYIHNAAHPLVYVVCQPEAYPCKIISAGRSLQVVRAESALEIWLICLKLQGLTKHKCSVGS